jgi:hypothetical protein
MATAKPASRRSTTSTAKRSGATKPEPRSTKGSSRTRQRASTQRTSTLRMPQVTMRLPKMSMDDAAKWMRASLPPVEELAYFAGLGLLGVLEVIEWPVVLAVGTGTVIAQRAAQVAMRHAGRTQVAASGPRQ